MQAPHRFPDDDQTRTDAARRDDQTDEALAAFGLRLDCDGEDPGDAPEVFWLFSENWPLWQLWRDVETQLRGYGLGGAPGLDYPGVLAIIDRRFRRRDRRTVFWLIQAMEQAALEELREQAERDAERAGGR